MGRTKVAQRASRPLRSRTCRSDSSVKARACAKPPSGIHVGQGSQSLLEGGQPQTSFNMPCSMSQTWRSPRRHLAQGDDVKAFCAIRMACSTSRHSQPKKATSGPTMRQTGTDPAAMRKSLEVSVKTHICDARPPDLQSSCAKLSGLSLRARPIKLGLKAPSRPSQGSHADRDATKCASRLCASLARSGGFHAAANVSNEPPALCQTPSMAKLAPKDVIMTTRTTMLSNMPC